VQTRPIAGYGTATGVRRRTLARLLAVFLRRHERSGVVLRRSAPPSRELDGETLVTTGALGSGALQGDDKGLVGDGPGR